MEKNLKKVGVMFMLLTAITFGSLIGLFAQNTLVVTITLVLLACNVIVAHYLITRRLDHLGKHNPIEVMIILMTDIIFGLFAGAVVGVYNPTLQLATVLLVAICGFVGFYIMFLKNPKHDAPGAVPAKT